MLNVKIEFYPLSWIIRRRWLSIEKSKVKDELYFEMWDNKRGENVWIFKLSVEMLGCKHNAK